MNADPIEILIVDDHAMFIEGIKSSLINHETIHIGASAKNGEEAVELVAMNDYDVVLLDINMPKMNGIETCKKIRTLKPDIKVIALSMHSEQEHIRKIMEAGARAYLVKNVEADELRRAIQRVYEGEMYFSSDVALAMMSTLLPRENQSGPEPAQAATNLSKREIEIIRLVAQEYTTAEIARKLFISDTTVETHRRNILHKIGAKSSVGIIKYAVQHKLL